MIPVKLRGHLGARFGTEAMMLDVSSPGEAVQALCATLPGFEDYVRSSTTKFKILVRGEAIDLRNDLHVPSGHQEVRIVPVIKGAKSDGFRILEGALLVTAAFFVPEIFAFIGVSGFSAAQMGAIALNVGMMGTMMALGGIAQALSTAPSSPSAGDTSSALFSNASNTVKQGTAVPVAYGEFYVTPPLISETIETTVFNKTLFNYGNDGIGTWTGNGDTTAWGASLVAK